MCKLLLAARLLSLPLLPTMAHATPTITVVSSLDLLDFTSLAGSGIPGLKNTNSFSLPGVSVTFTNPSDLKAGVYQGSTPSVALSPYPGAHTDDHRNYLVAQANDTVNLFFNSLQTMFGLLWGSVDTYNELAFIGPNGTQIIQGGDIPGILHDGTQNAYVMISGLDPFNRIMAIDHNYPAFEFVPDPPAVPEPRSIALLGLGLLGFGTIRYMTKRSIPTAGPIAA